MIETIKVARMNFSAGQAFGCRAGVWPKSNDEGVGDDDDDNVENDDNEDYDDDMNPMATMVSSSSLLLKLTGIHLKLAFYLQNI